MSCNRRIVSTIWPLPIWLEGALIAILPCWPLFLFSQIIDHNDWYNHSWMIGYTGTYLRSHAAFPEVYNANQAIGYPIGVFYGYGLYAVLGIISTVFNPQVAILLGAYSLFWLQQTSIVLLLTRLNLPRWFASAAALTVTFCIYPLTNLYNRNAITEFFAAAAMVVALSSLMLSFISEHKRSRQYWYVISLIMFGLMATTHPITLRLCADFTAIFCLLLLLLGDHMRKAMLWRMAGIPLMLTLLLGHWLYAFFAIDGKIGINYPAILSYPDNIDTLSMRLSPVLYDRRFWDMPYKNIGEISTPFLDAPVNMFVFFMALTLMIYTLRYYGRHEKIFLFSGVMIVCWSLYLWCSLSTYPYGNLVPLGYAICQFGYRMVNMINLSAIAMLFGAAFWLKVRNFTPRFPEWVKLVTVMLLTASSMAFAQKMITVTTLLQPREQHMLMTDQERKSLLNYPSTFYGIVSYISNEFYEAKLVGPLPVENVATFTILEEPFGDVPPINVHIDKDDWYKTNIYSFIWNQVIVDGLPGARRVVPTDDNVTFNVRLGPGDHKLQYKFEPPPLWRSLRKVALATAIALFGVLFSVINLNILDCVRKKVAGLA